MLRHARMEFPSLDTLNMYMFDSVNLHSVEP